MNRLSSCHAACQRVLRVVIYMYWNERDHPVAHFHAYHAGRRASVSVNGEVLADSIEPRDLHFVREWAIAERRLASPYEASSWTNHPGLSPCVARRLPPVAP